MLTIKGYGEMSEQTARDVAEMVDVHDRPGQLPRFQSALRREIVTALGTTDTRTALNTARTAASVLARLNLRERPQWVRSRQKTRSTVGASVMALRSKPRASIA